MRIRSCFVGLSLMASVASANADGCPPSANSSPAVRAIPAEERAALIALYEATDGARWKDRSGWLGPPGTECQWYRVLCHPLRTEAGDFRWGIRHLWLSDNGLSGRVPPDLAHLRDLESLDLLGNRVVGRLHEDLLKRWSDGSLDLRVDVAQITDIQEISYDVIAWSLLCGDSRIVLRSDGTATRYDKRCRNRDPKDRVTFCETRQGRVYRWAYGPLARLVEQGNFWQLSERYSGGITDVSSSRVTVVEPTRRHTVQLDGGALTPLQAWALEHATLGVASSIRWEPPQEVECPKWD